jgi:outer membrane protein assembly factor BamB
VYAFTADGVALWQYEMPLADAVAPGTPYPNTVVVPGEDDRIYCITNRGDVTVLDESGAPLTHFLIGEKLYLKTLPLITSDGFLYVEAADGDTLGVDADGAVCWRFPQC